MEPDLRAFLRAAPGQGGASVPAAPVNPTVRLAAPPPPPPPAFDAAAEAPPPPPQVAPMQQHNTMSIADVFLVDSPSDEAGNSDEPLPQVAEVANEQMAVSEGNGEWRHITPPPAPKARRRRQALDAKMPSLGILDPLMGDDDVHDILISGLQPVYVDVAGQIMDSGLRFSSHEEVWKIAEIIMDTIGQRWNPERPLIDTRLPDGSRVNIVAPPLAVDGVTISIRKFPIIHITLQSMVEDHQLSRELSDFLSQAVANRVNIVISGGTSSGKTTLLNALSGSISPKERIVTIEDSAELRLQQPHVVRMESKLPLSIDAPDTAVTIRDLVKNALRMRPDRIVVGESRGIEAFDVIQAMNTGHDGSMTTLHANSPRDALSKIETMVSMAIPQFPVRIVRQQIASTIQLIIQMSRTKEGGRRITHVSELSGMEGETMILQDLVVYQDGQGNMPAGYYWAGGSPRHSNVLEAARFSGMLRTFR